MRSIVTWSTSMFACIFEILCIISCSWSVARGLWWAIDKSLPTLPDCTLMKCVVRFISEAMHCVCFSLVWLASLWWHSYFCFGSIWWSMFTVSMIELSFSKSWGASWPDRPAYLHAYLKSCVSWVARGVLRTACDEQAINPYLHCLIVHWWNVSFVLYLRLCTVSVSRWFG